MSPGANAGAGTTLRGLLLGLLLGCGTAAPDHDALTSLVQFEQLRGLPDGGLVYLSDRSGNWEVWAATPTGDERRLSHNGVVVDSPSVGPDGRVVFAADGGGDDIYDLWQVPGDGSTPPRALTRTPFSESAPVLSPDGTKLAWLSDETARFKPQLVVGTSDASAGRTLTGDATPVAWPVWSPDSARIAVTRTANWSTGPLVVVSLTGEARAGETHAGETHTVAPERGMLRPRAFAPSGGAVLATTTNAAGFHQLALVGPDTGRVALLGPAERDVEDAVWSAEHGIIFTQNVGGQSAILRMEHPNAPVETLADPKGVVGSLVVAGEMVFFDRNDSASPPGIWRTSALGGWPKPVVATPMVGLVAARPFTFPSFDGRSISGFVYEPVGSAPHPAVVTVHGGPDSQSRDAFDAQRQALAQAGFLVIDVNYRGSTGYGKAFTDLDNGDWGGGDRKDLRAAVEHLASAGLVDSARVGIMGGSFGGYLTLMALCLDADLYRAGVDLYGMPDLVADYEMTRDRFADWYAVEMGNPTEDAELFRERSPSTWLERLTAPLLVLHGENDSNVPKAQSDALVAALRKLGRAPTYVTYPNEGHVFSGRSVRKDVLDRVVAFFRQHLNEEG